MKDLTLDFINDLEEEFTLNDYNGVKTDDKSFKIIKGQLPILISSPHSVDQVRKGMLKPREVYSGALCKLIQKSTNCYAIYKNYNDGMDDNFIHHTSYKMDMGKLLAEENIKLVIDLHGMVGSKSKRFRGYYVELGTDNGKNLLGKDYIAEEMIRIFNSHGVPRVVRDKKFKASRSHTIAKYVASNFQVPAVQVEISGDFRNPLNYDIENVKKLLNSFKDIIYFINSQL